MEVRHILIPSVGTNCYLLIDEESGSAAVIDPGDDVTQALTDLAAQEGFLLKAVCLTHGHFDHIGGVAALRAALPQIPVYLHPEDARIPDPMMNTADLEPLTLWRDGDVLTLGGLQIEVLHTPGHTRGSVVLRCRDTLFTGDTLFAGSCGRTDFPGGDWEQMMESLRRLHELEGDYKVLPGHSSFSTLDRERRSNPYMRAAMAEGAR